MRLALLAFLALAPVARADAWDFHPPRDPFVADALLDLRSLNEKVAGQSGFVTVGPGGDFRLGDGSLVRFWAVNTTVGREKPFTQRPLWPRGEPDLAHHARFLAKRGVNMVRLHAHINPEPPAGLTDVNRKELDWIWRTVAAMKKEGIYVAVSPYWANTLKIGDDWGVPGGPKQSTHGLLFFDETLQKGYKAWWKALVAEKNPHTGIPLAQDPSVALLQIQNEDSLLFWTINNLQGEQRTRFGKQFASWCAKKHGSIDAATKTWDGFRLKGDDPAKGVLDFENVYFATIPTKGGQAKRLDDQVQFWCETMLAFHQNISKYLRDELGCKQVINAGNWKTASTARLEDAERWTYTANEVLAVNRYFGGLHTGQYSGWAVAKGDRFTRVSALRDPRKLPINVKQARGKAMMVTESAWVMPNGYAAEGTFLTAAYMALNGLDGFVWFATGDDGWSPPMSANGYLPSQAKWPIATPDVFGTFPAAALLYRNGYVKKADPAVVEVRPLADLWARKVPGLVEESSFDPNRDAGNLPPKLDATAELPWETFLVGPAEVVYDGNPAESRVAELAKFVDRKAKTVRSLTGEMTFDHGKGVCLIDAPRAQGVAAFTDQRSSFQTADLTIDLKTPFATVTAVPLDGKPLRESEKVLVQFGSECRPSEWRETPAKVKVKEGTFDGFDLASHGKAPWKVTAVEGKVTVRNPTLRRAVSLDPNGERQGELKLERAGNAVSFAIPADALYVVLTK